MGYKELAQLEDMIFQVMESLYQAKHLGNKTSYDLALATLDILNYDYKELTGKYFVEEHRIMKFHEDKWEITWIR
jgi:hypothetical protein